MLMPLETLPGWPKAQDPTALEVLGLLVGAPLVVIILVAVLARMHHAVKGNAGVPGVANQPIWVNGRQVEASTHGGDASRAAIDSGYEAVSARSSQTDEEARGDDDKRGGAGARW